MTTRTTTILPSHNLEQLLKKIWAISLVGLPIVYLFARHVLPHDTYLFNYSLGLYLIDSVLFFLTYRTSERIGVLMVIFMINFQLIVISYYALIQIAYSVR